jgi:hypothetical protein
MDKSSPAGDAFRATVLDYLKAELAAAEPVEREDLLSKAEMLLQFDHADAKFERAKEIEVG